jgi:predicted membrane protein
MLVARRLKSIVVDEILLILSFPDSTFLYWNKHPFTSKCNSKNNLFSLLLIWYFSPTKALCTLEEPGKSFLKQHCVFYLLNISNRHLTFQCYRSLQIEIFSIWDPDPYDEHWSTYKSRFLTINIPKLIFWNR